MNNLRQAAEQALAALGLFATDETPGGWHAISAIIALRAALSEPLISGAIDPEKSAVVSDSTPEPVAWRTFDGEGSYDYCSYEDNEDYIYQYIKRNGGKYASWVEPLYTAPPPPRKPLTDDEIAEIWLDILETTHPSGVNEDGLVPWRFTRAIEKAHGIVQ